MHIQALLVFCACFMPTLCLHSVQDLPTTFELDTSVGVSDTVSWMADDLSSHSRTCFYYDSDQGDFVPCKHRCHKHDKANSKISIDGRKYTQKEYRKLFVTSYTYNPKINKFKIKKCLLDKELDKLVAASNLDKRHDDSFDHPIRVAHRKKNKHRLLQCMECGMILKGFNEACRHFKSTGHGVYDWIDK